MAEAETAENDAVKAALKVLNNTSQQPGLLGEVSIETDAGQVRVAALSMESLADAEGPAEISAGSETGVSAEVSMELLGEVASAAGAGDGMILLSMSGLTEDAASSLATDDVRAVGARRLASALRSQPISIHFRTADGTKINVQNLTTPMKIRLKTDDPNATCAFWDKSAAQWSSEGVQTLSSKEPGFIHCSTTHLSIFAGIIEVAVRSVLLRLECSTLGLLLQLEALEKLLDGEWLGRPATWVAALMVVVFGILLVLARRLDQYHLRKLPLNQRELLLLRLRLDGGDAEGLAGCAAFCAVIDAVFHFFGWLRGTAYMMLQRIYERRFDLLFIAAVHSLRNLLAKYVVHRSIGLLQVYRSSTAPGTARVLQSAFGAVAPENPEVENGGSRRITQMRRSPSMCGNEDRWWFKRWPAKAQRLPDGLDPGTCLESICTRKWSRSCTEILARQRCDTRGATISGGPWLGRTAAVQHFTFQRHPGSAVFYEGFQCRCLRRSVVLNFRAAGL